VRFATATSVPDESQGKAACERLNAGATGIGNTLTGIGVASVTNITLRQALTPCPMLRQMDCVVDWTACEVHFYNRVGLTFEEFLNGIRN
jgi:hypothetical protein